jgi:hypothetical protein
MTNKCSIFPNKRLYIHIAGLQVQLSPIVEKNSPNDVGFYPSSKPIEKDQKSQQASNKKPQITTNRREKPQITAKTTKTKNNSKNQICKNKRKSKGKSKK